MKYDRIIIGAGIYGLYAALRCGKRGEKVLVLERGPEAFSRATYVNQARVHMGYHYPRSYSTAKKSAGYFKRFNDDFGFAILKDFKQIYATSTTFSWTNAEEFEKFCKDVDIRCEKVDESKYFKDGMVDGAFETEEYTFDAMILKDYFLTELGKLNNVKIIYNAKIVGIQQGDDVYKIKMSDGTIFESSFILNATYGSINEILDMVGFEKFKIKYELCEIILCNVSEELKKVGLTVMDGPFFSIMPFGKTGYHSLTSVTFTPHKTSYGPLPKFDCQRCSNGHCSPNSLGNCNDCAARPETAWPYMSNLAHKYLKDNLKFEYVKSLFSIKSILLDSEIDDSRPTVVRKFSESPTFVSVLSGKINTIYDLDEVLDEGIH